MYGAERNSRKDRDEKRVLMSQSQATAIYEPLQAVGWTWGMYSIVWGGNIFSGRISALLSSYSHIQPWNGAPSLLLICLGDGPIYVIFNLETLPDLVSSKKTLTHSPRLSIIYGLENLYMDIWKYFRVWALSISPNSFQKTLNKYLL